MTFASTQRARLAHLLKEKGENAPTLCEGWTTKDMAIHLYVRENKPLAAAGMFVPQLSGKLAEEENKLQTWSYEEIVDQWASGPHGFNPMKLADPLVNAAEYFVHAEDVRRGEWGKTAVAQHVAEEGDGTTAEDEKTLRLICKVFAKALLRSTRGSVVFEVKNSVPLNVVEKVGVSAGGDQIARVKGSLGDLVLWMFGREAVDVEVIDPHSILRRSSL